MKPTLQVKELNIGANFKTGSASIVSNLTFEIRPGERLAIVGESGCGKTMTALALLGLLPDNCHPTGEIIFEEENLLMLSSKRMDELRGKEIVLLPQSGGDFLNPVYKVKTQMIRILKRIGIRDKYLYKPKIQELLRRVGFDDPETVMEKYPFQLSGGMAQRVLLAMGLAASPKLIIADEPTRGIDDETAEGFLRQLEELFHRSAVMVITHNISVVKTCHKLLVMYSGELMEYGKTHELLEYPAHPYTKSLIDALPFNGFQILPSSNGLGTVAKTGCPFSIRCPLSMERCQQEKPGAQLYKGRIRRCFYAGSEGAIQTF